MFFYLPKCLNFLIEITKEKGEVTGWIKAESQKAIYVSAHSVNS
jgi:hypothetical protein